MTTELAFRLKTLKDDFAFFDDWEERYRHIIDLGKALSELSREEKNDTTRVLGCASQVWLVIDDKNDHKLWFRGDSDAFIVKGLIAMLIKLLSGLEKSEVKNFDINALMAELELSEALSSQRTNGLKSMVTRLLRASQTP